MNAVKKSAAKKAAVTKKPVATKAAAPKAKVAKASVAKSTAPKTKPVAKPAAKSAKPVAKPTPKKPVTKAPAKKVAAAKPVAKKVVAKAPAKASVKTPVKAVAKPVSKAPAKAPVKVSAKVLPKPAAKAASKTSPKAAPKALTKAPSKVAAPVAKAPVKSVPAAVVAPAAVQAPAVPRATKASARLAQITVPSMAQAVASTAAKSSYLPTMPSPVISAPLTSVKKNPKLANNWKSKSVDELCDDEILAMPDSEYMNDVQLAYFKRKLIELKQGILENAGETTEHLREDTVVVPDPADRATIEEEHALELRTRDRERKLLKKIEQSINLIDAGDYGYCDETGEPIGVGRLLARPTATLSLEAQQRRELKQKMFGD